MRKILITLLTAALAATASLACADEKTEPLSVPAYLQSVEIILQDSRNSTEFLREEQNIQLWMNDLVGTRDLLERSIPVAEQTVTRFERLTPPASLQVPHAKIINSYKTILANQREIQSRLAEMTTNEELQQFKTSELPLPGAVEAARDLRESCNALQEFGLEQGVRVNLDCDRL